MRLIRYIFLIPILITGCSALPYEAVIQTGVAGTQMALPTSTSAIVTASIPTEIPPTITPLPFITDTMPVPTETPSPTTSAVVNAQIGEQVTCGNRLIAKIPQAPEFNKDLFEHHAEGTFLMLILELVNTTDQSIQIWDGDYSIESDINEKKSSVQPHRAATTYLYIQKGGKLMQDQVDPGVTNWETHLAFDVDPQSQNRVLVFKPGFEGGQALCEIHFNLTPSG